MYVSVGYNDNPDSVLAGPLAAQQALEAAGRADICDLVLLFCTARHNQRILRREVARITGNSHHIYGGGAAGIITNDNFGYAGDQVGVACIWLGNSNFQAISEGGLSGDEYAVGMHLGKRLADVGIRPNSPLILLYDAVKRSTGPNRLAMATRLLEGMEKELGFLPNLMGAGLQGDYIQTPTLQFLGTGMASHHALALSFSDDIHIDSIILHGCRPASPYYTVTKAEGSHILEINGEPAIAFVDRLLGPSITPDQYPFFLLFGINHGQVEEEYDERNYASRLCQGIDKERGGIVMFEPDMVAGTRFQIMFRTLEPDYIHPTVGNFLNSLKDKEPFFSLYLNCARRGAGYGGTDIEDAYVIQEIVQNRFPLLGLYTGVEIAPIGGKARSLDWTGVFCVFSKCGGKKSKKQTVKQDKVWKTDGLSPGQHWDLSYQQLKGLCVQNMAKVLALDVRSIAIRNELEQKRRGFSLLAELSVSLQEAKNEENIFLTITKRINAALNMQKTALLLPAGKGCFIPVVLQGFKEKEKERLEGRQVKIDDKLLAGARTVLVTAEDDENHFAGLRQELNLPYFISVPIMVDNELAGILITGRMMEAPPFLSRLGENEAETVRAIATLLSSTLVHQRLAEAHRLARTDMLTGLYNRGALELQVVEVLSQRLSKPALSAFIMIDLDHFKDVNDTHGHVVGDEVLKMFGQILGSSFRSIDIVSRFGGDEFVIFCTSIRGLEGIQLRARKLVEDWSKTPLYNREGEVFYSTLSMGISIAPIHGNTYNELMQKADIALYKVKHSGRNGYLVYDEKTMK